MSDSAKLALTDLGEPSDNWSTVRRVNIMQNISFSGLASGLDTSSIISSLLRLERLPIQQLEGKKELNQGKIDLIGTLKGHLSSLKEKAEGLSSLAGFLAFKVDPSEEGVADFTTSDTAIAGSHTLSVLSVATSDRYAFDAVADANATIGAGGEALSFDINQTTYQVNVPAGGFSLNTLAAEINSLAGDDAAASVVNSGTEANPQYQLVLASNDTGEDGRITNIVTNITGLGIDTTPPDAQGNSQSVNHISVGNNAVALIDGLQVERSTNDFSGVVEGVTINALAADPGKTINFTVSADTEKVKEGLKELVDSYNEVIQFINKENTFSEEEGATGGLFGDSILRTVKNSLTNAFFNVDPDTVANDTLGFSTLSLIGIDVGTNGELTINDSELDAKIGENLNALADLFVDTDGFDNGGADPNTSEFFEDTTADSGLTAKLISEIDRLIKNGVGENNTSIKSAFNSRTDALNSELKRFDTQIESRERYVERVEASLVTRYANLESLISQINSQGAALFSL